MKMKNGKKWLLAGLGLVAFVGPIAAAAGIRVRRALQTTAAPFMPRSRPAAALRDAGWVHVLSTDGMTPRGRGQLYLWSEPALPGQRARLRGRIEVFTAASGPLQGGDPVILQIESAQEHVPVTVHDTEVMGGRTTVWFDWTDGDLPATLRELGGH